MSQKIRQGNDIDIHWSLLDADENPYILEGRNIEIELEVGKKRVKIRDILDVNENTVHFVYYGKDQKYFGSYNLKFIENNGAVDMVTFDTKDAFTMVEHSWLAIDEGETPETIQLEFVTISSNIHSSVGPRGLPAGFGEITVDVDDQVGTPSAEVIASGPDTEKNLHFSFSCLKGRDGQNGITASEIPEATPVSAVPKLLKYQDNPIFPMTDKDYVQGLAEALAAKQAVLISGENIKTINGQSILGSGDIPAGGGASVTVDGHKMIFSGARVDGHKLIL